MFDEALRKAEQKANLAKLDGSLWHAYRRKWVTERKHEPEIDVTKAGNWQDRTTFRTCYQQSDEATVLRLMNCPNKLMDKKLGTIE